MKATQIGLLCVFVLRFAVPVYGGETCPWGMDRVRTRCQWDNNRDLSIDNNPYTNAGAGITVAVIDTGMDYYVDPAGRKQHHRDLNANIVGGIGFHYDWPTQIVETKSNYQDISGHGTMVTGVIGAVDNSEGIIGVAPKVNILCVRVYTRHENELAAAIDWAANYAQVISMSLGGLEHFEIIRNACARAWERGRLLIAAAGDNWATAIEYPAAYNYSVIAVGTLRQDCARWNRSNTGAELEFTAPGVDINTTMPSDIYGVVNGSSFACPHVSAVAALIFSSPIDPAYDSNSNGVWENTEVRSKLRQYALDLGTAGRDVEYGYGLVNGWCTLQRPYCDLNIDHTVEIEDVAIASAAFAQLDHTITTILGGRHIQGGTREPT